MILIPDLAIRSHEKTLRFNFRIPCIPMKEKGCYFIGAVFNIRHDFNKLRIINHVAQPFQHKHQNRQVNIFTNMALFYRLFEKGGLQFTRFLLLFPELLIHRQLLL